jgi:hypothetical protein
VEEHLGLVVGPVRLAGGGVAATDGDELLARVGEPVMPESVSVALTPRMPATQLLESQSPA